ncbi:hypothetical protein ACO0LB_11465 [Undibacterium sp. SXout7W]|uniref:hypothetical protein n=1 Tax=Undibacterium sp. SXout7W TaxID=3413049 RepID=UPI003BF0D7BE
MKKNIVIHFLALISLALPLLEAKASDVDWVHGGRHGWVLEVYDENSAKESLPDCLKMLPKDELSHKHFVKVHYKNIKKHVEVFAEVPSSMELGKGDEVEVFPEKCSEGKLSHITKLLEHAHPHELNSTTH